MKHPYLAIGQDVIYVDINGKNQKGTITEVITPDSARIEFPVDAPPSKKHQAIAEFSENKGAHTFHFADASAEKEKTTEARK